MYDECTIKACHFFFVHEDECMALWGGLVSDSSGLPFYGADLQPCKTMTDMLASVEHANRVLSAWNSTFFSLAA